MIAIYLWIRNRGYDRWNTMFITSFAFIQLWEAGIWRYRPNDNIFLKLILLTLLSQPLMQTFGAYTYTTPKFIVLKYLIIVYLLIFVYGVFRTLTIDFYSTIGREGHLVWNATDSESIFGNTLIPYLYIFGMFFGLFYGLPKTKVLLLVGIFTFLYALSYKDSGEFSSYWCYIAVLYSGVAIFVN